MTTAGESLQYMKDKRQRLLDELHSDAHYEQTPTLAFGDHDPLSVTLAGCDECACNGHLKKHDSKSGLRWIVECAGACGKISGNPRKRPWQAALDWNGRNLAGQRYEALPLFGLSKLGVSEASQRLNGIRRNLEVRKNLAGVERRIAQMEGSQPPGKKYQERLEAYLAWAMLGQRLVKYQKKQTKQSIEGSVDG